MKNLYYFTKKKIYKITRNANGTVTFYPEEKNAGSIIFQRGGVASFLTHCIEDERNYEEIVADRELVKKAEKEYRESMRRRNAEKEKSLAMKAYKELLAKYGIDYEHIDKAKVVDVTPNNILVLMRYLRAENWGTWHLPSLSQVYQAAQYDCNGKTAVTLILGTGIMDSQGRFIRRFQYGASAGYLTDYVNISRL